MQQSCVISSNSSNHAILQLKMHRRRAQFNCCSATTMDTTAAHSQQLPTTRQAWHITKQGDMSSLQLTTEPMPVLLQQQQAQQQTCLVEVKCLGLNLADVFCCLGLYKAAPKGDFIPGLEFAGTVLATSDEDDSSTQQQQGQQQQFKRGDRVLGVLRFGAFSSHVAVPAAYLRPIPESWSFQQAASYPVQTLTAAYGLFECGGLKPGQAVLVQSAAGGVGLQALQILNRLDCSVLGLVGGDAKVQLLSDKYNSATKSSNSSSSSLQSANPGTQQVSSGSQQQRLQNQLMEFGVRVSGEQQIKEQLSGFLQRAGHDGFNVILDSLGGEYFKPSYAALGPCGRHVIFGAGALTPKPGLRLTLNPLSLVAAPASLWGLIMLAWGWLQRPKLDVLNMPGDNKGVVGFNLIWLYNKLDLLAKLYEQVEELELQPPMVGHEFEFNQLPEALVLLQSGQTVGKVVCSVKD